MTEHSLTLPQFKPDNVSETTTTQILLTPPPEEQDHDQDQGQEQEPPLSQTQDQDQDHNAYDTPQPNTLIIENMKTYLTTSLFRASLRASSSVSTALDFLHAHPVIATLLVAQFVCSCVPIGLFIAGAVIVASLAVALYSCVAVLVLAPVVIGTSILGFCVWGWGWVVFVVGRWVLGVVVDGERGGSLNGDLDGEEGERD
ncbi:hypothetical protein BDV27DRAFT_154627 [Aspergillus caelatus]|uniref:Uncharacterized protein n=2 Tax=Aspergillus subgen. Circumdati TaxID=2720871 RepID=A0A5N7ACZ3_9EURO|nr:uncharacterized protein BDV27DRAFT_154627 [Aspergillus caelatus]KAE8367737.1 hypothetical protein BDV27DRAFT_154627 [Aspergillus caelatus]KAE8423182.1 hypothetical protein BDV36DRAFT_290657 [Aspergillus pseudocaelatus]